MKKIIFTTVANSPAGINEMFAQISGRDLVEIGDLKTPQHITQKNFPTI
jgi:hypothetical protein